MQFMQLIENHLLFPTWWLRLNVQLTAGFAALFPPTDESVRAAFTADRDDDNATLRAGISYR
jgi:hypothetical protein